MFKKLIAFSLLLFVVIVNAQKNDNVLFSIDGEKVYTSEFVRVYQKNKDIVIENDHKDFDDYFDLFVDFKLKLKQAYDQQLDTSSIYIDELKKYREQLVIPYLQNPEATEFLIEEAYNRTITEVNASHILVRITPTANPKDTLLAFQKITKARNEALSGDISFEEVAKQYSEDPSAKQNGGSLGYFSAFSMVYPFENAAFNTKKGEISKPFRTQFGYHIVKVNDKRNSFGEVQVAHIMVKFNPEKPTNAKSKIFDIYKKLEQQGDFKAIAQQHSDDSSAKKGGVLPRFGTGKMIKPFEETAFGLQNEGDFSAPFKTNYGWHILKLLKKYPVKSFEESHDQLESKIKNGNRSIYVEKALANKLKKKYIITENLEVLSNFYAADADKVKPLKTLLVIEDESFTSQDFYNYSSKNKNKTVSELYDDFKSKSIINYYKNHLEKTNKEFAIIYQEYKDGLLLFELLQKEIWKKSEKDTIGLLNYFENNQSKYAWKKRAELSIASCTSVEKAKIVKQYLEENKTIDQIKKLVNEGATIHVLFSSGTLEEGNSKLPKEYEMNIGISKIYNVATNQYIIVKTDKVIPPSNKKFDKTRGEVINDYQIYLEKEWVDYLRKKYKIKVNKKTVKKLKLKYPNL